MTTSTLQTLADYFVPIPRCSGCSAELPQTAKVERYDNWIVAECPQCKRCTPFKAEAA